MKFSVASISKDMKFYWYGPFLLISSKSAPGMPWIAVMKYKKTKTGWTIELGQKNFRATEKEAKKYFMDQMSKHSKEIIKNLWSI